MIGCRIGIVGTVQQKNRNVDSRRGGHCAHFTSIEMTLLLRAAKRSIDDLCREEERRTLGGHGPKIGERLCRDDSCDARVQRSLLQCDCCAERRANEDDWSTLDAIDNAMEVTLL